MKAIALLTLLFTTQALGSEQPECPQYAQALDTQATTLVIVSAHWCGPCNRLKAWLTRAEIPYIVVDVDDHPKTAAVLPHSSLPSCFFLSRGKIARVSIQESY